MPTISISIATTIVCLSQRMQIHYGRDR